MPTSVRIATIALGVSGFLLLVLGLYGVLGDAGSTGLRELGALLGIAELLVVGRLMERRQSARMVAISFALVQALGALGVIAMADQLAALGVGIGALVLPGLVVVPLSTEAAEQYFRTPA